MNITNKSTLKRRFSIMALVLILVAFIQSTVLIVADRSLANHAEQLSAREIPWYRCSSG